MTRKEIRSLALELIYKQIEYAYYSLECSEYENMSDEDVSEVTMEMNKIQEQFKRRYFSKTTKHAAYFGSMVPLFHISGASKSI